MLGASGAHAQTPVDLSNPTDRTIEIEIVSNSCTMGDPMCDAPAVYALDLDAEFTSLGEVPLTFLGNNANITIAADGWEQTLFGVLGESANGTTDPGIVAGSVTDFVVSIDTTTGGPGPDRSWEGRIVVDGAPPVIAQLTYRATDTTRAVGEFGAAQGTDYFFYDANGFPVSCDEHVPAVEAPQAGECLAADFRGDELYDPATGTFTFLGVVDNNFVQFGLASPLFQLTAFRITEVPEPTVLLLNLAMLATLSLLGLRRARGSGSSRG